MSKKVIVAGHICLDITPIFPENKVNNLAEILNPGKLIHMNKADVHTGGAVANTGLAMKSLGADISLMGKVGTDAFGDMVLHILQEYDADKGMLSVQGESTSYSVVIAVPGIDRIFLHHPGANDTFVLEDIPEDALEDVALFHFGYPPLMQKMYENNGEELVKIFKKMKSLGIATSLDLAMVDPNSKAGQANWGMILQKVLPYVDFFVPSAEELCFMLDRPRFENWQLKANGADVVEVIDIEKDIKPLAQKCLDLGAKVLLIKCGAPGLYYRTSDVKGLEKVGERLPLSMSEWSSKEGFEVSYKPNRVLSGTGAGDTSIAAFLTAMLNGYPLEKCIQLASATGASCVEAYDALSGLKSFEELEAKINAGWEKNQF